MRRRAKLLGIVLAISVALAFTVPGERYFDIAKSLDIFATLFKEVNAYYVDDVDPKKYDLLVRHVALLEKRDGTIGSSDPNGDITAFFIPRKNYFLGKYLMHGGVYPDGTVRLVKNGSAHFELKEVHDQMVIDGRVSFLSNDLIHMADPQFSRYLKRSDRYTSLQATEWFENFKGKKHNRSAVVPGVNPVARFVWVLVKPKMTFLKMSLQIRIMIIQTGKVVIRLSWRAC